MDDGSPIRGEAYVLWAYRVLLGREPESWATVRNNAAKYDRRALVRDMMSSQEFADANGMAPLRSEEDAAAERADELALLRAYRRLGPVNRAEVLALADRLRRGGAAKWSEPPSPAPGRSPSPRPKPAKRGREPSPSR